MSSATVTPPMLRLPLEVLERVFEFVVPCGNERYWDSIEPVPQCVTNCFHGWKESCSAIRLACRSFSQSLTLKRALFHTIYWFPTNDSLERLRNIVEHFPDLVRCFSWYAPVFGYEPVDETSHLLQLRNETRVDVEAKLLDAGLSRQQRSQLKKILAEGALPFHDDDIRASLSTVQAVQQCQAFILQSEHTTVKLCQAFSRLPNLATFTYNSVCGADHEGRHEAHPLDLATPTRGHLLSKWYPHVLIQGQCLPSPTLHEPQVGAYSKIVNAMWAREIKPHDFAIAPGTGWRCTKGTFLQIPDFREMRHLSISVQDETSNTKLRNALKRNGRLLRNLESLCFGASHLEHASESMADVMQTLLPLLPKLKSLWLYHFAFDEPEPLLDALKSVRNLQVLKLQAILLSFPEDQVERNETPWQQVFELLRAQRIDHCEVSGLCSRLTDGGTVSHLDDSEPDVDVARRKQELNAFVRGTGEWTAELQEEFVEFY